MREDEEGRRKSRRAQPLSHRGRPQSAPRCPVCGHPVGTTVERHKTLGAYVPRWIPQPCGNPDCGKDTHTVRSAESAHSAETERSAESGSGRPPRDRRAQGHGAHRADLPR